MEDRKINLSLRRTSIRQFSSVCQFIIYLVDILIRIGILGLIVSTWLASKIIVNPSNELSEYVAVYIVALFVWGLLLIKFLLQGKDVFGKTRLDLFFMGILSIVLLSSLLSQSKVQDVFGIKGSWSFSVTTLLSVSILYYVIMLLFRYLRGIKWLSLGFVLSLLFPGIYYSNFVLRNESVDNLNFLVYAVLSVPLCISMIFMFKKRYLKLVGFLALVFTLYLTASYSVLLQGAHLILGIGVLCLFVLFYFAFWVRNSNEILGFLRDLLANIKTINKLKAFLQRDKKRAILFLIVLCVAFWIVGFVMLSISYFNQGLGWFLKEDLLADLRGIDGFVTWLIGDRGSHADFSSYEFVNILTNYGFIALMIYTSLFIYVIVSIGKFTLKLLFTASWKNVIFASSLFITICSLFAHFLISRYTPYVYLLLLLVISYFSIITDIVNKEVYSLGECVKVKGRLGVFLRYLGIILVVVLVVFGIFGLLSSLEKGIFWNLS